MPHATRLPDPLCRLRALGCAGYFFTAPASLACSPNMVLA
jgi:hypothetical protein